MKDNRFIKWSMSSNTKSFWTLFVGGFLFCLAITGFVAIKYSNSIEEHFLCILAITILFSIIAGLSAWLYRLYSNKEIVEIQNDDDDILINDLIQSLNKELNKSKYQEVITIGHILNKPLFTIGKYELRLEIGKLVKRAAVSQFAILKTNGTTQDTLNKYKEIEMIELIDSIGWMKVELGDVNEGKVDIENGITIAEQLNTDKGKFYEAKAYRHFGAIERRKNHWTEAFNFNDKSLAKANEITDEQLKTEAIAAANYARAFVFKGQNDNYEEALQCLDNSISKFEQLTDTNQKTMKVCMANEAKARFLFYSKQNENDYHTISRAKRLFEETLSVAEGHTLRLEMIRCYIGLAECNLHVTINNVNEAKQYIEKAKNVKIKCDDDQKRIKDIEEKNSRQR